MEVNRGYIQRCTIKGLRENDEIVFSFLMKLYFEHSGWFITL